MADVHTKKQRSFICPDLILPSFSNGRRKLHPIRMEVVHTKKFVVFAGREAILRRANNLLLTT